MPQHLKRIASLLSILSLFLTTTLQPAFAQGPTPFANCRLGVGSIETNISGYDIESLNMGRYLTWWVDDVSTMNLPAGVEYIRTVRVHQKKEGSSWWGGGPYVQPPAYSVQPGLTTITGLATAQPGALWVIGNEIDRRDWNDGDQWRGQDEITPEVYATAFHDIQAAIRAADPTARIGIASVVQPTTLRLRYLDRVWDSYFNQYGYSMGQDIDVWNVHGFILREVFNKWGSDIPAGLVQGIDYDANEGFLYGESTSTVLAAHHDIAYFQQFMHDFRAWMASKGERHKPLINTEYGVLYTNLSGENITDAEVSAYLTASFDYLFNATDLDIGYPADENRLVQGWVWYSLQDDYWNGQLFDPASKTLTEVGTTWQNYVSNPAKPLASQSQQNLLVTNARTMPAYYIEPTQAVTFTLQVDVANSGNSSTSTGDQIAVSFWDGPPDDLNSTQIGATQIIVDLPGCGHATTVEVEWVNRTDQVNEWYVKVEPLAGETDTTDNLANDNGTIFLNQPQAELSLTKTVDQAQPLEKFDKINYTIAVANPGPDAAVGLVVNDSLPPGLKFKGYKTTHGTYFSRGAWFVGDLAANATAMLTITASVEKGWAGQTMTNTAFVSDTASLDLDNQDNQASVSIVPRPIYEVYLPTVMK